INTGQVALNNLSWRFYFTTENSNAASAYTLEKYYDQSNAAAISGPTLACGSTYYYTVTYSAALPIGTTWGYNSALHLSSYGNFDASNDWWHTGYAVGSLPAAFTLDSYIPAYYNGSLMWGTEPACGPYPTGTMTPTFTLTPSISKTPTMTSTRTLTPVITLTPTRTPTPTVEGTPIMPTMTRTPTAGITNTPTRTPTAGVSSTPTRTLTSTITPTGVTGCSPVTSTITAPFTYDGAGTFCWQSTNLGSYINSWNVTSLTVNGVNELNLYVAAASLPAKINGYWYVSYNSAVSYGHFEAK
ncbi:MAG: hypothetical protein WA821_11745, partial [Anaerolineales bacterium]